MIEFITSEGSATLARWVGYLAASLLVGVIGLRALGDDPERHRATYRRVLKVAGLALLGAALLRMTQQALLFAAAPEEAPAMVGTLVGTAWGRAWLVQVIAALSAVVLPGAWLRKGLLFGVLLAVAAVVPPAFQGHAMSVEGLATQAVVADALHLVAAGIWVGTLAVLAVVRLAAMSAPEATATVRAFSPWALGGAATLAVTGLFASWLHVATPANLVGTPYGRALLLKVGLVAGVAALGAWNWKRVTPQLPAPGGLERLRRSARAEVVVAVLVLLVTASLVATSLPGE